MNIIITLIAAALIFLSGIGIGAAITDQILRKEEMDEEAKTNTAEAIGGQDDTAGSQDAVAIP